VQKVVELAKRADVVFVGVGQMSDDAPLLADGFVTRAELDEMQAAGASGEVAGWVFDSEGNYLDFGTNRRTGGVRVSPGLDRPAIGIAAGASKVPAIRGGAEIPYHQRLGDRRAHRFAPCWPALTVQLRRKTGLDDSGQL
jgi:DNA-binding transcriptional regulator LsrR (DeoR family)